MPLHERPRLVIWCMAGIFGVFWAIIGIAALTSESKVEPPASLATPPKANQVIKQPTPQQANRWRSREELEERLIGRTTDQVLEFLGRPDSTQNANSVNGGAWYYRGAGKDLITGRLSHAQIIFSLEDRVVERINFN